MDMDRTTTQDIQEMLEGLLNDEQTAEVLHRLSVSPEKLTAFRQHMALQGAFDRDGRNSEMTEDEDNAVWAAVLGATGGVVTGGATAGASGWLGRAAAFVATGIAGFFIGTATDIDPAPDTPAPIAAQEQTAPAASAPTAAAPGTITRIDTVIRTVVEPQIIYRDRIVYRNGPATTNLAAAQQNASPAQEPLGNSVAADQASTDRNNVANDGLKSSSGRGISADARNSLTTLTADNSTERTSKDPNSAAPLASGNTTDAQQPPAPYTDPNRALHSTAADPAAEAPAGRSDASEPSDPAAKKSGSSLMASGWEVAYNERIGRIAPAPAGLNEADPNFGGRAIDLSYRLLEGRLGIGGRLIYGSFSRITLEEEKWFALGEEETKFHPALGTEKGFGTEVFLNYRLPLFSDRLALGTEFVLGASSTHSKLGGEFSLLYLITNRIGAQIGAGYSRYFYNTTEIRQEALDRFLNTGTTSDLNETYQGSMLEGRYGLFLRF